MLSEAPRVRPQVQNPGSAGIAQQRRCVQLCPRIFFEAAFCVLCYYPFYLFALPPFSQVQYFVASAYHPQH